jgi:hypothetical protein
MFTQQRTNAHLFLCSQHKISREIQIKRVTANFSKSLVLSTRKFRLEAEYKYKKQLNGDEKYMNSSADVSL